MRSGVESGRATQFDRVEEKKEKGPQTGSSRLPNLVLLSDKCENALSPLSPWVTKGGQLLLFWSSRLPRLWLELWLWQTGTTRLEAMVGLPTLILAVRQVPFTINPHRLPESSSPFQINQALAWWLKGLLNRPIMLRNSLILVETASFHLLVNCRSRVRLWLCSISESHLASTPIRINDGVWPDISRTPAMGQGQGAI
ncbi:hypothetical protein BDV11DRAFT_4571 [Aspergillus similis]